MANEQRKDNMDDPSKRRLTLIATPDAEAPAVAKAPAAVEPEQPAEKPAPKKPDPKASDPKPSDKKPADKKPADTKPAPKPAEKKASPPPVKAPDTSVSKAPAVKPLGSAKGPKPEKFPPAKRARLRLRHILLLMSFLFVVLLPSGLTGFYLWERAADQYTSNVGFTVRREETPSAGDILGGLTRMSQASSSDSDILFEYIQSQELVSLVDAQMDLRSLYSATYDQDPIFALAPDATIEELVDYWRRMVRISYAPGTGLIELRVHAFEPEQARSISQAIFNAGTLMINELSSIARADALRYAQSEFETASDQLKEARLALTVFRSQNQIVDPTAYIQLQMGLLDNLQRQLSEALIDFDLISQTAGRGDPRVVTAQNRIEAIEDRIQQEREKFGGPGSLESEEDYAALIAEFERLTVEREFAEQKYTGALQNLDAAQAEAQRQSRYLAAYLQPTLAQSALYPQRLLLFGLTVMFLMIGWCILALIFYALRDRR